MKLRRGCDWKLIYEDYLNEEINPHWKRKKAETWRYYLGQCADCGSMEELEVHHTNYDNLFAEIVGEDVILLCDVHHDCRHSKEIWLRLLADPYILDWSRLN